MFTVLFVYVQSHICLDVRFGFVGVVVIVFVPQNFPNGFPQNFYQLNLNSEFLLENSTRKKVSIGRQFFSSSKHLFNCDMHQSYIQ